MVLTPGMVIAGRYRVETKVGAGGMGEVWAGEHIAVGSRVALKTLLNVAALEHEIVARFKREAYFLGRIRSEYVARVVDFVADDNVGLVLVMEFVEGEPLSKILQTRRLTVEEGIDLGVDVVTAVRDLHTAKVIHRDLKPGNIIMQPRPDGSLRAMLVDFGVSRAISGGSEDEEMTGITRADMAVGTIEYMAPEQILSSRDVIAASDIYAVGAILFRAVAGHHIFGDVYDEALAKRKLITDPSALRTGRQDAVAKGLEEVVSKAIKRRPNDRYDSADQILVELVGLRDMARTESNNAQAQDASDEGGMSVTRRQVSRGGTPSGQQPASNTEPTVAARRASPERASMPSSPERASMPSSPERAPMPSLPERAPMPSSPERASSPSSPEGVSMTPSTSSTPRTGSDGRSTGADSPLPTSASRSRGIPALVAVLLVAVALAGGVGIGSWVQRKLTTNMATEGPPAAPPIAETTAPTGATAAPTGTTAAPAGTAEAPAPTEEPSVAPPPAASSAVASTAPSGTPGDAHPTVNMLVGGPTPASSPAHWQTPPPAAPTPHAAPSSPPQTPPSTTAGTGAAAPTATGTPSPAPVGSTGL